MKAKNIMAALLAVTMGTSAYAFKELVETMTVELSDGSKVEYTIGDIEKVSFDIRENNIGMMLTSPEGTDICKRENFGGMFRYIPQQEGTRVQFLFGTAENASALGDLATGSHLFVMEMAPSALYQGEVQLTGEEAPASITMHEYTDGEISNSIADITTGTVSTSRTAKGVLTVEIDATFANGTSLKASYNGTPADVTDLEELFPTPGPKNDLKYFDNDGNLSLNSAITGVKKTVKGDGMWKFSFLLENNSEQCFIEINPQFIGSKINFATAETGTFNFRYSNIQLSSPNNDYRNQGAEGFIEIIDNGDGTCTIYADVTNKYKNMWGEGFGGNQERVVIDYGGACEGLEPVVNNEMLFFNPDGIQINQTDVVAVSKKTVRGGEMIQYSFEVANADLAETWYNKIYIQIPPSLIGEEFDITTAESLVVCYFCDIQVASPNNEYRPVAKAGKIKITDDEAGNITIAADVTDIGNQRATVIYNGTVK